MKKSKLLVLSLLAVSALGLTSCGSQGPKGEKGEPGIQGKQGEPGKDGKDGVNGKDGKDGAPGKDGKDGKDGSNGADGKTAWSNTILPSVGGYVVPSVGSAVEGVDVTFTVHVENDYTLTALFLNGENHSVEQKTDKTYETTAKMVKNGFVVSATFIKTADIATTPVVDQNTGKAYKDVSDAIEGKASTIRLLGDTSLSNLKFDGDNNGVTIDLNNKVLKGAIEVVEGSDVIIKNGNFDGQLTTVENAKATFENVKFDKDNADKLFEPSRKASETDNKLDLTFKNCEFVGPNFGFSTNAKWKSTNSYGKITFEGCTFTPKDPLNGGDATGLMINVPVNVEINNCTFNGSRQCLIVRCGTVEVKDSTFNYNKAYDGNDAGHFLSGSWRDGNRVATAMITVGSLNGTYPSDATLKLTGTNTFIGDGEYDENHKSIVIACGTNSATLEMTSEIAEALKANAMTMKPETVPEGKTITIKIDGKAVSDWLNN